MRKIVSAISVAAALFAYGDTFRTNTVEGLVHLLRTKGGSGHVIELEAGDYFLRDDLTWYTNDIRHVSYLFAEKAHIKGLGERPEDTRLIGGGSFRIIEASGSSVLENLTITNGYAAVVADYGNSGRGGGIYGGAKVTNCLVTCNYAETFGGGGAGSVKFLDSLIINNEAGNSGGGFHSSSAVASTFVGNVAKNSGGAVYTATLYDCEIISNRTTASYGGGGYNVTYATNCLFAYNHSGDASQGGGGGVSNGGGEDISKNLIYDCTIVSNTSAYYGGGAYRVTIIGGKIIGNTAMSAGGAATCTILDGCDIAFNSACNGRGGGVYNSTISNCVVRANICSNLTDNAYGGGVNECTVYDSEIFGNYSKTCVGTGGANMVGTSAGAYKSELYGCNIHDNYSDSYGGGVRDSVLYGCTIVNNCAGNDGWNAYNSRLIDCEVVGSGVYGGSADRTVFREIGTQVKLDGNPYIEGTFRNTILWKAAMYATNSLFCFNEVNYLYQYASATKCGAIVNCTVVSNKYDNLFNNCKAEYPFTVENSFFYGNRKPNGTTPADISLPSLKSNSACQEGSLIFRNCAYGTYSASGGMDVYTQESMYVFGADGFPSDPKFMGAKDANNPFALKPSSPLIGKGAYASWMDGSYDIRGEGYPRVKEGRVDIGCYQCWLDPVGTVFSIR